MPWREFWKAPCSACRTRILAKVSRPLSWPRPVRHCRKRPSSNRSSAGWRATKCRNEFFWSKSCRAMPWARYKKMRCAKRLPRFIRRSDFDRVVNFTVPKYELSIARQQRDHGQSSRAERGTVFGLIDDHVEAFCLRVRSNAQGNAQGNIGFAIREVRQLRHDGREICSRFCGTRLGPPPKAGFAA